MRPSLPLRRAIAVGAAAVAIGCAGPSDPGDHRTRLALDCRSSTGEALVAADLVSVLGSARLTVGSSNGTTTQSVTLGPSESEATFSVRVPTGAVRFDVEVLSNNQTVLFRGDQTVTVDRDGFNVTIKLRPVAPVLVVTPRVPAVTTSENGQVRFYQVTWILANVGIDSLRWRADSAASPGVTSCLADDRNCFRTLAVPTSARRVDLFFRGALIPGPAVNRNVVFQSNVGSATATLSIPN